MKKIGNSISPMAEVIFFVATFLIYMGIEHAPALLIVGIIGLVTAFLLVVVNCVKQDKREKSLIKNGVFHSVSEVGIVEKLGKKLTYVEASKGKIILVTVLHTLASLYMEAISILIVVKDMGFCVCMIAFSVIALGFGLLPLRHWKEYLEYYENGFSFCGEIYLYAQVGEPKFIAVQGIHLTGMWMNVKGNSLKVSYLKNARKQYIRTYMKGTEGITQHFHH